MLFSNTKVFYRNKYKKNNGYLLIELIVSIGLFLTVVGIAIGSVVSLMDSSRRLRANKDIMDNLNLTIDNMARTIRFSDSYHCDNSNSGTAPLNCTSGANYLRVQFNGSYSDYGGTDILYRFNGTNIDFSKDGGASYFPLNASDVSIDYGKFYVFGTSVSDSIQPYVIVVIKGHITKDPQSTFDIQTVMAQRQLDI
jgi:type II secretory pathway pseudopilin PulG